MQYICRSLYISLENNLYLLIGYSRIHILISVLCLFPENFTIFLVSYKLENARYDAKVHNFAYRTYKS